MAFRILRKLHWRCRGLRRFHTTGDHRADLARDLTHARFRVPALTPIPTPPLGGLPRRPRQWLEAFLLYSLLLYPQQSRGRRSRRAPCFTPTSSCAHASTELLHVDDPFGA
ncbi:Os06g0674400 [Oryza sativa Japonica Group]|uniref:Uncharacterized protein n=3 Tax=Oryza TaxID=4527 RepID=Q651I1_ORYSJ|nr:hypothetical protein OsJ_22342 [Oryza sativa Japonica Group]KAB8103509.1 hypothetical protein EE612_036003 [Oryza sativa]BAD46536.1 hypothetical protein [Oryza sativa Japonica Group]BAD46692.1 hypothetical protein [Oryza sativa Japonica Group]BAS99097.1 Os06g0674400 [Oryza sativa Japonica Group]